MNRSTKKLSDGSCREATVFTSYTSLPCCLIAMKIPPHRALRRAWNPLRWLLAVSSLGLATITCFGMAVLLLDLPPKLCPQDLLVSGVCTAPWAPYADLAALSVALAVGGFLFVGLPSALAPARRFTVAMVAFGLGLCIVTHGLLRVGVSFLPPFLAAALSGGAVAWRKYRSRPDPGGRGSRA